MKFYANRSDGLGERLCALFNAILLSEISQTDFCFSWPPAYSGIEGKFHAIESPEKIFAKKFIKEKLCPFQKTLMLSPPRGSLSEICEVLSEKASNELISTPQYSLISRIQETAEVREKILIRAAEKIEFSDEIKGIQKIIEKASIPRDTIAIHIRAGDIVYGKYSEQPFYARKVIPAPAAIALARKIKNQGGNAILFGQEDRTIKLASASLELIQVEQIIRKNELPSLEQAMVDIFLMKQCKEIYAAQSGFPRFSANTSGRDISSISSIMDGDELSKEIDKTIKLNPEWFTPEQISYSYFFAYDCYKMHEDYGRLQSYINSAIRSNPKSMMLQIISLFNAARFRDASQVRKLWEGMKFEKQKLVELLKMKIPGSIEFMYDVYYSLIPAEIKAQSEELQEIEKIFTIETAGQA